MLNNPKGGLGYAAEFQSSGLPYVTSSVVPASGSGVLDISFAKVTRFVSISNLSAQGALLRVGFTQNGTLLDNYYLINGGSTELFELRVKELFLMGHTTEISASICAGLTNIDSSMMPTLTGTLTSGDPGWEGVG